MITRGLKIHPLVLLLRRGKGFNAQHARFIEEFLGKPWGIFNRKDFLSNSCFILYCGSSS